MEGPRPVRAISGWMIDHGLFRADATLDFFQTAAESAKALALMELAI